MIVCCGEALVDMVPDRDAFLARPGGCPFNTAVAAARLGARCAFLGRIGKDFLGDLLAGKLRESGVDLSMTVRSDQPATLAFVHREHNGDARYAFYSNGAADRSLESADLPASLGDEARFLMVGSISMLQEPAASTIESLVARESRKLLVSLDPNVRPGLIPGRVSYLQRFSRWAAMSSIVKVSSDDLEWLWPGRSVEDCARELLALGPELVVVTLGSDGSAAFLRESRVGRSASAWAVGFAVAVADTIGAGDTFHASLLASLDAAGIHDRPGLGGLSEGWLRGALDRANAAAALDCTRAGADPPTAGELEAFIRERSVGSGGISSLSSWRGKK